jgi:membrane protease YdiL (CAAX protease family)
MISHFYSAILLGIVAFFVLRFSWKKGFFFLSDPRDPPPLRWFHLGVAFLIYLTITFISPPLFTLLLKRHITPIPPIAFSCWVVFLMSFLILLGLASYLYLLPKEISKKIWHSTHLNSYSQDIQFGLLGCAIAFPLILFLGEFFDLFLYLVFHIQELPDQLAVLFLKMTLGYPLYFSLTFVTVVFFAPCIEEILFRGFLQSFFRTLYSPKISIGITSFCFALFHYSPDQGAANLPILVSLFILSLFLGLVYEKKGSLLTPIFLHGSFNLINILNLYLFESSIR